MMGRVPALFDRNHMFSGFLPPTAMATAFSWTDRLSAFSSCLPCLRNSPSALSLSSPSQDQLHRLLADPESSSSLDPETLSLHSNPGNINSRRRRQPKQRGVTLFGFHLFGRRPPAIQLPTDDIYDPLYTNRRITAPGAITPTTTTHSATTFDSDAAPLDLDTIDSISSRTIAAVHAAEEDDKLQKEERRRKRRERKEMKKMAKALAVSASEVGEFEGFQGSGDGYPGIPSPFRPSNHSEARSSSSHQSQERRKPVPSPTSLIPHLAMDEDDDDEGADLDGMVYARRTVPTPSEAAKSLTRSSDSRSRTSTSLSDRLPYRYPQPPRDAKPMKSSSTSSSHKSKRTKSNSISSNAHKRGPSKSTATRSSTTTRSDSPPISSPTSPSYLSYPRPGSTSELVKVISPGTIEQGQGFFDIEGDVNGGFDDIKQRHGADGTKEGGGFPSTGFGLNRVPGIGKSRDGVFLAQTSAEELEDEFDDTF